VASTRPSLLRQIVTIPAEIVVGFFLILDAIIRPLFTPLMRWLSALSLIKRIERAIGSMHPYLILVLLVVPFGIAELTKVLGVYLMSTGHFRTGMTLFIGAYVVSIVVCERTFHAGKDQLLTIPWFAKGYGWVMMVKDHIFGWFKQTRVWRMAVSIRQGVRLTLRRLQTRLRLLVGGKPKGVLERL
jgi:hypothetical protein